MGIEIFWLLDLLKRDVEGSSSDLDGLNVPVSGRLLLCTCWVLHSGGPEVVSAGSGALAVLSIQLVEGQTAREKLGAQVVGEDLIEDGNSVVVDEVVVREEEMEDGALLGGPLVLCRCHGGRRRLFMYWFCRDDIVLCVEVERTCAADVWLWVMKKGKRRRKESGRRRVHVLK